MREISCNQLKFIVFVSVLTAGHVTCGQQTPPLPPLPPPSIDDNSTCPPDFTLFDNQHCYYLSSGIVERNAAAEHCGVLGGTLGKIYDTANLGPLADMLQDTGHHQTYIGFNNLLRPEDNGTRVFRWSYDDTELTEAELSDITDIRYDRDCYGYVDIDGSTPKIKCTDYPSNEGNYICQALNVHINITSSVATSITTEATSTTTEATSTSTVATSTLAVATSTPSEATSPSTGTSSITTEAASITTVATPTPTEAASTPTTETTSTAAEATSTTTEARSITTIPQAPVPPISPQVCPTQILPASIYDPPSRCVAYNRSSHWFVYSALSNHVSFLISAEGLREINCVNACSNHPDCISVVIVDIVKCLLFSDAVVPNATVTPPGVMGTMYVVKGSRQCE